MLGSGANGKKPIKEVEKLRARKAKLEHIRLEMHKGELKEVFRKLRAQLEKAGLIPVGDDSLVVRGRG